METIPKNHILEKLSLSYIRSFYLEDLNILIGSHKIKYREIVCTTGLNNFWSVLFYLFFNKYKHIH